MIADSKPRSRYFSGLVVLSVLIGFVAVMAWPQVMTAYFKSAAVSQPSSAPNLSGPLPTIITRPNDANFIRVRPSVGTAAVVRGPITELTVVDGDTVRSGGSTYRLVGFNTPESGDRAGCDKERRLSAAATARLQALIAGGAVNLERVACACRPGTEGTRQCNFGRLCGRLTANGRDVGPILIGEGLAETYVCGATSCPRRRNWC